MEVCQARPPCASTFGHEPVCDSKGVSWPFRTSTAARIVSRHSTTVPSSRTISCASGIRHAALLRSIHGPKRKSTASPASAQTKSKLRRNNVISIEIAAAQGGIAGRASRSHGLLPVVISNYGANGSQLLTCVDSAPRRVRKTRQKPTGGRRVQRCNIAELESRPRNWLRRRPPSWVPPKAPDQVT